MTRRRVVCVDAKNTSTSFPAVDAPHSWHSSRKAPVKPKQLHTALAMEDATEPSTSQQPAATGSTNSTNTKNKSPLIRAVTTSRGKTSKVWDYFKLAHNRPGVVICSLCKIEMAYHISTSAMLEHLKRKHPCVLFDAQDKK